MNRRTFVRTTVTAVASSLLVPTARAQPVPKAKNVVLVHGLFAAANFVDKEAAGVTWQVECNQAGSSFHLDMRTATVLVGANA
jgi:hypothetical protein